MGVGCLPFQFYRSKRHSLKYEGFIDYQVAKIYGIENLSLQAISFFLKPKISQSYIIVLYNRIHRYNTLCHCVAKT